MKKKWYGQFYLLPLIRYLQDDFEQLSPKLTTASVMEVLIDGVRKRL